MYEFGARVRYACARMCQCVLCVCVYEGVCVKREREREMQATVNAGIHIYT